MTATDLVPDEVPDLRTTAGKIDDLERRRHEAVHAGPAAAVEKQHASLAQRTAEYEDTLANPYTAAQRGYVDAVIRAAETRTAVTRALVSLRTKRETLPPKKHGNVPL